MVERAVLTKSGRVTVRVEVPTLVDMRSTRQLGRRARALGRRFGFNRAQITRHLETLLWLVTHGSPEKVKGLLGL